MKHIQKKEILACGLGILIGALFAYQILPDNDHAHTHEGTHQITQPDEEYHVHADFLIFVNGEQVDLSDESFMTTATQSLHTDAHLHDGNGEVKHIHAEGITFAEFLNSLNIQLDSTCLSIDDTEYCSSDSKVLALYVNNEPYEGVYEEYIPVDDDRVLLYFGENNPEQIATLMNQVKSDSCYYSGTCPERGIAPPESCGLTCEL